MNRKFVFSTLSLIFIFSSSSALAFKVAKNDPAPDVQQLMTATSCLNSLRTIAPFQGNMGQILTTGTSGAGADNARSAAMDFVMLNEDRTRATYFYMYGGTDGSGLRSFDVTLPQTTGTFSFRKGKGERNRSVPFTINASGEIVTGRASNFGRNYLIDNADAGQVLNATERIGLSTDVYESIEAEIIKTFEALDQQYLGKRQDRDMARYRNLFNSDVSSCKDYIDLIRGERKDRFVAAFDGARAQACQRFSGLARGGTCDNLPASATSRAASPATPKPATPGERPRRRPDRGTGSGR